MSPQAPQDEPRALDAREVDPLLVEPATARLARRRVLVVVGPGGAVQPEPGDVIEAPAIYTGRSSPWRSRAR